MINLGGCGVWSVKSEKDKRWSNIGYAFGSGLIGPQGMYDWIDECKEQYGDQPDDLKVSFIKD